MLACVGACVCVGGDYICLINSCKCTEGELQILLDLHILLSTANLRFVSRVLVFTSKCVAVNLVFFPPFVANKAFVKLIILFLKCDSVVVDHQSPPHLSLCFVFLIHFQIHTILKQKAASPPSR